MSTKSMKTLKEILCKELDEFAYNGQVNRGDLEDIFYLTENIKNIGKILMLEGGRSYDGGMSNEGASGRGSYARDGSYGREGSYGDGYISRNGRGYSGRYSYGEDNEMVTQKLEEMMTEGGLSSEEKIIMHKAMDILRK